MEGTAGGATRAGLLLVVLVGVSLAGCVGEVREYYGYDPDSQYVNPGVFPGRYSPVESGSSVLTPGPYPYSDDAEVLRIPSDQDGAFIPMAVWRPYDGLAEGGVPILVDAGPYFETTSSRPPSWDPVTHHIDEPQRHGEWILRNFVPHGYAYAQVAVRGTGTHGGCMEYMSPAEARDVSQAVSFLANLPWANGNVSLVGLGYDGSTPWMVAGLGNPHVKSIVPAGGTADLFSAFFRNGTAGANGATTHAFHWQLGFNQRTVDVPPNPVFPLGQSVPVGYANGERQTHQEVENAACPEVAKNLAAGPYAAVVGERDPAAVAYWDDRDWRDEVLANYEGSVFLIHGFRDAWYAPHVAVPLNEALREAGVDVKEWYGQWGSAMPDSTCAKEYPVWMWLPCRGDFAEVLLRHWERTLKGLDVDDGPRVQVQDDHGHWRNAASYPPGEATWVELYPARDGTLAGAPGSEEAVGVLLPPDPRTNGPANHVAFTTDVFEDDTWISGLPQLKATFEAAGPAGFLAALLWTEDADGRVHGVCSWSSLESTRQCGPRPTGWAQMDLRFRDGGETVRPVVPGVRDVAHMEFEPLDALVPAGHRLTLWVFQAPYGSQALEPASSAVRLVVGGPDSTVLRLSTMSVDRADTFPVPGSHTPQARDYHRFMVAKPWIEDVVDPYALEDPGDVAAVEAVVRSR